MVTLDLDPGLRPPRDAAGAVREDALAMTLAWLDNSGYDFVTVTPASHAHVIARRHGQCGTTLRDIFGWSLPFAANALPQEMFDRLVDADIVVPAGERIWKANIRVSRVHRTMFVHSAYPTLAEDAVFLGPDSWRFADLILAHRPDLPDGAQVLDYGAGAGVGGIIAALSSVGARLTLADINPAALRLAASNAAHAGVDATTVRAEKPADLAGPFDLIVTHPPFMIDEGERAYRDGGDLYGARLSLDWAVAGARLLAPGGRLILHTGVAVVEGEDVLRPRLETAVAAQACTLWYNELDPDIFGEELATEAYADVDRIAAVGAVIERPA